MASETDSPRFVALADLPENRRAALVWRYALKLDYDGVHKLVEELSALPCRGSRQQRTRSSSSPCWAMMAGFS
jgi:hypothetical protein